MLLSYRKKFIFVHIFKTAGTSVMDVFLPDSRFIDRLVYGKYSRFFFLVLNRVLNISDLGNKYYTGFHKHATAQDISLGFDLYKDYYVFVFVRNPYDLMVSLYFYIRQSKSHKYNSVAISMSFPDFVEWYVNKSPYRQVDFVYANNVCLVNYIAKFENLSEELSYICDKLNISFSGLGHKNRSKDKSKKIMAYYDDSSLRLVNEYYSDDFEKFGYHKINISELEVL